MDLKFRMEDLQRGVGPGECILTLSMEQHVLESCGLLKYGLFYPNDSDHMPLYASEEVGVF